MDTPIRVGIVDDHPGVRVAIRDMLANADDILVVGEGGDGNAAIQIAENEKPDVLSLDVELPVLRGDEVVQRIHDAAPEVQVLALSGYDDPVYILGMLENGAAGYITKDEAPDMLLNAVRSIKKDNLKWISPGVAKKVLQISIKDKEFSGIELEILRFVVLHRTNQSITRELNITQEALDQHIKELMDKFNVTSLEGLKEAAQPVISTTNN